MNQLAREYVVLVLATLVWGSVHPTVKFALSELTGLQLALMRPVFACLVLMALVVCTGRAPRLLKELRAAPGVLLALGVLGYATSGTLTSLALTLLPAGVTSLISNSSPLVLVVAGLALFRQRIGTLEIVGSLVGFGGVALLTAGDLEFSGDVAAAVLGSLLALGSAASWAIYTAVARRLGRADPLITTAITSFIGSLVVAAVAVPTQDWGRLGHLSNAVLISTLWAGAVATGCTYAAWSFALRRLPAVVVAPFAYLIPVSALAIAHVWLGEALTLPVLVGAGLVLAGVAFSQASQFSLLLRARRKTTMKI
ncbi:MAG: DMT family transporter [Chloroflexi bacterium]|nr:MAG: DMT family transporter [Chloroflexota bacterium]